jgi:hypothetical protein
MKPCTPPRPVAFSLPSSPFSVNPVAAIPATTASRRSPPNLFRLALFRPPNLGCPFWKPRAPGSPGRVGGNWTKGIDQKTGLPIDCDPKKDIQVYSGLQNQTMTERTKKLCPSHEGANNYWSASFSQRTRLLYIPSRPTCNEMTMTPDLLRNPTGAMLGGSTRLLERTESEIVVADPFTGEVPEQGARLLSEL